MANSHDQFAPIRVVLTGNAGSDAVSVREFSDRLDGADGDDLQAEAVGNDILQAEDRSDVITGSLDNEAASDCVGTDNFDGHISDRLPLPVVDEAAELREVGLGLSPAKIFEFSDCFHGRFIDGD